MLEAAGGWRARETTGTPSSPLEMTLKNKTKEEKMKRKEEEEKEEEKLNKGKR